MTWPIAFKEPSQIISSTQVRFILMNSFSTSDDTKAYLAKEHSDLMGEEDVELVQNKSPKVDAKTLDPIEWKENPDQEWYAAFELISYLIIPYIWSVWTSSHCKRNSLIKLAVETAERPGLQCIIYWLHPNVSQ